jgi:hypothetical protein
MHESEASSPLELMTDLTAADWLADRLVGWPTPEQTILVGSVVPTGFEAYARVLHPPHDTSDRPIQWADVAASTGRMVHPEMDWERIIVPRRGFEGRDPVWAHAPLDGYLDPLQCAELATALAPFTDTPQACWFCYWAGFGDIPERLWECPRVRLPGREYLLLRGPLDAVTSSTFERIEFQAPNIWWPDDRNWCVATEIDLMSTYVGGSQSCIDALAGSSFEAIPTGTDARVDHLADRLNAD